MKYLPKVSIVIPAYNASNYLAEAIDSALAQTYKNIEIIVVNDGSKDNGATATVAKAYGGKIRYFEKENGGSSSALNYGIRKMTGEWFSWLSHDDLYFSEKVEQQVSFLNELLYETQDIESHVLFGACELINAKGDTIYRPSEKSRLKRKQALEMIENNAYLIAEAGSKYSFNGCSCLINKSVFSDIGMFDETLRIVNDVDMWKRIFVAGYHIHFIPELIVKGRVHEKQVSVSVGFSYHNPEQDAYWQDLLNWLLNVKLSKNEHKSILLLFAKSAYSKTRKVESKIAFSIALSECIWTKRVQLRIGFTVFTIKHNILNVLKNIYRKMILKND